MLKTFYAKHFVECFEKISNLLEEQDDFDVEWRITYLGALSNAYLDAERKQDASKIADKIMDLTKKKGQQSMMDAVARNRVHVNKENSGLIGGMRKEAEGLKNSELKFFIPLQ